MRLSERGGAVAVSGARGRAGSGEDASGRFGVTPREAQVLALVVARYDNSDIAARLNISKRTVETHLGALLRKFAVPDRKALIRAGARLGPATVRPGGEDRHARAQVRLTAARARAASAKRREIAAHQRAAKKHDAVAERLARIGKPAAAARAEVRAAEERRLIEVARSEVSKPDNLAVDNA